MSQTLDSLLARRASAEPDRLLYQFLDEEAQPEENMTFGQLHARAAGLATHLLLRNKDGRPVLVAATPGSEHPIALFACFLAGFTAIPVYPPQGAMKAAATQAILAIAQASGARVILANEAVASQLVPELQEKLGAIAPDWLDIDEGNTAGPAAASLPGSKPKQAALLLFTSGSTGQPKGVILPHHALMANLEAVALGCGRGRDDVVCSWLPQGHIAGLFLRLFPVVAGCRGVLMSPQAFMANPLNWLSMISRHGGTVTAAPDFAYALTAQVWAQAVAAKPELSGAMDLSSLTMAISGGEMVRAGTLEAFSRALAPCGFQAQAFHPYYGLTETMCSSVPQGEPIIELSVSRQGILRHRVEVPSDEADRLLLVGNGSPIGDTEIVAVDPGCNTPVGEGGIGEIWVRGTAVTPGYVGTAVSPESWQGRLTGEPESLTPFFRTGDLGFLQRGQVFITGRLKELIIVRGKNHYPLDVEATVSRQAASLGAGQCAAFAVRNSLDEELLGLAIEVVDPESGSKKLERTVRAAVANSHGLSIERFFVLPKGGLPRTPTQKIVRLACARLAQSGQWQQWEGRVQEKGGPDKSPSVTMYQGLSGLALEGVVLGQVLGLVARCDGVNLDSSDLDRPVASLGLSSLHRARLSHDLRKALGVDIPVARLFDQTTPRQLAQVAARLIEGKGPTEAQPIPWRDIVSRLTETLPDELPGVSAIGGKSIFLTGATGFLGAWILHGLLTATPFRIICHVRAESEERGLERLRTALLSGPGWSDDFGARLSAVVGNLEQAQFSLGEDAFVGLAEEVGAIIHNAADVNFVAPFEILEKSNVEPLGPILALATALGRTRPIHFVSTVAVFNGADLKKDPVLRAIDFPASPDSLFSGYAKSKWVAEAVLRSAAARGLPVFIHRPSLVIGDSRDGRSHTEDFVCRFIKGCIQLGRYPDADIDLNFAGVDQVARGIIEALVNPPLGNTLHWSSATTVKLSRVMEVFAEHGHGLHPQPLGEWLDKLRQGLPIDNAIFPVQDFLLESLPGSRLTVLHLFSGLGLRVDTAESSPYGAKTGLGNPSNPEHLIQAMAQWMEQSGYLPAH